jgi:hypothetical protein
MGKKSGLTFQQHRDIAWRIAELIEGTGRVAVLVISAYPKSSNVARLVRKWGPLFSDLRSALIACAFEEGIAGAEDMYMSPRRESDLPRESYSNDYTGPVEP